MVKVLSSSEFKDLIVAGNEIWGSRGLFDVERLDDKIRFVHLLDNKTRGASFPSVIGSTIVSTVCFGIWGIFALLFTSKPRYSVTCDIYLDNTKIEVWTNDHHLITLLTKYM